jgi:hypothetical protein
MKMAFGSYLLQALLPMIDQQFQWMPLPQCMAVLLHVDEDDADATIVSLP